METKPSGETTLLEWMPGILLGGAAKTSQSRRNNLQVRPERKAELDKLAE